MTPDMKLWIVKIERSGYVLAKTKEAAHKMRPMIEEWEECPRVLVTPAGTRKLRGWDDTCLVYHRGHADVTLKAARKRCVQPAEPVEKK